MTQSHPQIEAVGIRKSYGDEEILHGVELNIMPGELTVVTGPNGSGKTTLLNIVAGLDCPSEGTVRYEGEEINTLSPDDLTHWRGSNTGYVFQRSGLLGGLTVRENILAPQRLKRHNQEIDKTWAASLCVRLSLDTLLNRKAQTLSGGEKQRVSLARALIHRPAVLFADEPTAAVDTEARRVIHSDIRGLVDTTGLTVVMVSHENLAENYADRTLTIKDGRIVKEQRPKATPNFWER